MKSHWISMIMLLALVLTSCGKGSDLSPKEPQAPSSVDEPAIPPPDNPSPNFTKPVEVSPLSTPQPGSPPQGVTTPMPDTSDPAIQKLIATATEDLAKRLTIAPDQIQFKEAIDVVWPDSSLGCPNPSSSYIQALTPGYLIRLQASDRTYEYHTDKKSQVVYCENPAPLPLEALPKE